MGSAHDYLVGRGQGEGPAFPLAIVSHLQENLSRGRAFLPFDRILGILRDQMRGETRMSDPQYPNRYSSGEPPESRFSPDTPPPPWATESGDTGPGRNPALEANQQANAAFPRSFPPPTPPFRVSGEAGASEPQVPKRQETVQEDIFTSVYSPPHQPPPPRPSAPPPSAQFSPVTPQVGAVRVARGPSWAAFIIGLIVAVMAAVAVVFAVWGSGSLFSSPSVGGSSDDAAGIEQSGAEVVEPVETSAKAPDWEAVAAAVRPATVSILVEGADESGSGSGVIVDAQGDIVTNYHVVSGAVTGGNITVAMADGRMFAATIVGTDPTTDLAVLTLENPPDDLTVALLGTSSDLHVGQPVMAIGAPLGLAGTVTTGIISALDRPVAVQASSNGADPQGEVVVTNAIQIDASINPGNSGGPLFNAEGAVIGINSSIASMGASATEAGSIGLGFAIPVDLVGSIVRQILETGSAQHALLGVEIQTASVVVEGQALVGAHVATVVPGGAAEQGGILPGDVIVGIDGNPVTSGPALTGFVRRYSAGDTVVLEVVRDGQRQEVEVMLQQR